MKIDEAFKLIGVDKNTNDSDLKKQYKKLCKSYHPDVYKEDPEKLKSINEAYQIIKEYKENPGKFEPHSNPFREYQDVDVEFNINDLFNNFGFERGGYKGRHAQTKQPPRHKTHHHGPIYQRISLSFKESLIGVNKEIKYKKHCSCEKCNGSGSIGTKNDCKNCNGFGSITSNKNGMIFTISCNKCYGRDIKVDPCSSCNSSGTIEQEASISISVPPGVITGSVLRLSGAGHYMGENLFQNAYGMVLVNIDVDNEDGLTLDGANVVSKLNISLLEALSGCKKEVKTAFDTREIEIPSKSKNTDKIIIKECGVKNFGNQIVILNIDYPENTEKLIEFLKEQSNAIHDKL